MAITEGAWTYRFNKDEGKGYIISLKDNTVIASCDLNRPNIQNDLMVLGAAKEMYYALLKLQHDLEGPLRELVDNVLENIKFEEEKKAEEEIKEKTPEPEPKPEPVNKFVFEEIETKTYSKGYEIRKFATAGEKFSYFAIYKDGEPLKLRSKNSFARQYQAERIIEARIEAGV
ncbi:hypothetical protein DMA11_03910 [Marinilabiliaceae bacterium JC017]|nr:hypothetical protein DMA11_03910 [Marinilabiliaceae bacterium JC017]